MAIFKSNSLLKMEQYSQIGAEIKKQLDDNSGILVLPPDVEFVAMVGQGGEEDGLPE